MKVGDVVARTMTYNMEDFFTSCVDRYLELAGNGVKLRTVTTPFLVEDQGTSPQGAPVIPVHIANARGVSILSLLTITSLLAIPIGKQRLLLTALELKTTQPMHYRLGKM